MKSLSILFYFLVERRIVQAFVSNDCNNIRRPLLMTRRLIQSTAIPKEETPLTHNHSSLLPTVGVPDWFIDLKKPIYMQRPSTTTTANDHHVFCLEPLSKEPYLLLLRNFLTDDEVESLLLHSRDQPTNVMKAADTYNGQGSVARPHSRVGWRTDDVSDALAEDVATLTISDDLDFVWAESMQVVHYEPAGNYKLHHDGHNRIATCLYYLNGVGETWFPFANSSSSNKCPPPSSRDEALRLAEQCVPGKDGILLATRTRPEDEDSEHVVHISPGDAVLFFSYFQNHEGMLLPDWNSLHAGLPAGRDKWIANHFFRIDNEDTEETLTTI